MGIQLGHPPEDRESLWWVVRALFGVTIPRTRVCPDHCSPFDAFADAYFGECTVVDGQSVDPYEISRMIIHASRGLAGKSKTLSLLGLAFSYLLGADITILGGSMSQSANVHEYMRTGMAADGLEPGLMLDATATRISLSNKGRIRPLPASQKNVRGPHPSILLCVAEGTPVMTPAGEIPIESLHVGQFVATTKSTGMNWNPVIAVHDQGYRSTLTVELSDQREITCTPDHLFATDRGWVEAQHLTHKDLLCHLGSEEITVHRLRPGLVVRCWDITTEAANFYANGVLVHNCDEVDEMELEIYDAAMGQPMPQPNYLGKTVETMTVISSTWQNPSGTLTEIFRRADEEPRNERGLPKTPIYRWCYKENRTDNNPSTIIDLGDGRTKEISEGWLTQKTIQQKIDSVSAEMFRIEYDLGEPAIGNRAFDGDAVDAVFSLPFEPVIQSTKKDYEEFVFAQPVRGAQYVAAADWAKEQDKTVIVVLRIDDGRRELVYFQRVNRRPYPVMIGAFNDVVRKYRVDRNGAWHDSTGLGNVVNDYLDMRARPFPMTGDKRAKLLSDFVNAIEKSAASGPWRLPKARSAWLEMKYCRSGDLYSSSKEYHLPDTVCAFALAEYAASKVHGFVAPEIVKSDGRSAPSTQMFEYPEEKDPSRSLADMGAQSDFSLVVG